MEGPLKRMLILSRWVNKHGQETEEKIKLWKVNGQQVMAKAHIAFGKVT
jgi:hypothetical protein